MGSSVGVFFCQALAEALQQGVWHFCQVVLPGGQGSDAPCANLLVSLIPTRLKCKHVQAYERILDVVQACMLSFYFTFWLNLA